MDLEFEPETGHLWAVCDDTCNGRVATLDVTVGAFAVSGLYERPAGMPNLNNEGFAIAPQPACAAGRKPVFWSDDSGTGGHALRGGTIACTDLDTDDDGIQHTGAVTVHAAGLLCGAVDTVVVGITGNDERLTGTAGGDLIVGRGGNDVVTGGGGADCVVTDPGNDVITTTDGDDRIDAGGGNNIVDAGAGTNTITAISGNDSVTTGAGDDRVDAGNGNNTVSTGGGNDVIGAGSGNDAVDCGAGADTAAAGRGNNTNTGARCETFGV
jgi:Ca2+-binding RTX toxin-like protein